MWRFLWHTKAHKTRQDDAPNTNPKYEQKSIEFNTPIDFGRFHEKELAPARKPKLIGKQFLGGKLPLEFPYHAELRKRPWIEKHFPFMITFLIEQILFKLLPKSNKQTEISFICIRFTDQRSIPTYWGHISAFDTICNAHFCNYLKGKQTIKNRNFLANDRMQNNNHLLFPSSHIYF